jgi:phosphoribosylformylglycinamidine cyclo-ligase
MNDLYKKEIIDPGDRASQLAKDICFQSHHNCPAVEIIPHQPDSFRGPVGFIWQKHILKQMAQSNMFQEVENDGAGGKTQFPAFIGTPEVFQGLGWEIIAMTADDFARTGRFPAVIDNEINIKKITEENFPLFESVMQGYGAALKESGLVNITGETAVIKHSITAFCDTNSDGQLILTWGASCIGLAHRDLLINGSKIKPDMPIIGFWEPGYRCNGGTFFTNLIIEKFGPDIEKIMENSEAVRFVKKLCVPSKSYAKTICRLIGWNPDTSIDKPLAEIAGIAHITGGGIWNKFGEILPKSVGANLYSMPNPAEVLLEAQELSWDTNLKLTDYQAYSTLHGGCGMLIVAEEQNDAEIIIEQAEKDGIQAQIVGETTKSADSEIVIQSRFREGELLSSKK